MTSNPKVSIIMPAFNAERHICKSIESVLNQTYNDFELIVINDASTDNTLETINRFADDRRLRIINNRTNLGVANSRNIGINESKGDYISFIDADDVWDFEKLKKQMSYMDKYDLVCSTYDYIDENDNQLNKVNIVDGEISLEVLLKNNVIGCSTVIVNKASLSKYKFDSNYKHEDYALWLTLILNSFRMYGINQCLVHYREHSSGRNFNKINSARNRWIIYRKLMKMNVFSCMKYLNYYFVSSLSKHIFPNKR